MRLTQQIGLGSNQEQNIYALQDRLVETNKQLNLLTEGSIAASHNAMSAAPTTGTWKQADFVRNTTTVEAGGAGNKYVILGWVRITSGTGNVLNTDWVACRCLTGN